jgi:hypothetical protein
MADVDIWAENVIIPALGAGILFNGWWVEYLPVYKFVQHLSVCLPLLIQPHMRNIAALARNRYESDHFDAVR